MKDAAHDDRRHPRLLDARRLGLFRPGRRAAGAWVLPVAALRLLRGAAGRFAAAERWVHRRTNAVVGPGGRLQLPWPRSLGTPPWGARHELESGAVATGVRYRTRWVRWSRVALGEAFAALHQVSMPDRPGVLFVGSSWLPRHVVLVIGSAVEVVGDPGAAPVTSLTVYEPSSGQVISLTPDDLERHTPIAGWRQCWVALIPGQREAGQGPRRPARSDAA